MEGMLFLPSIREHCKIWIGIISWTKMEPEELDQKTSNLMTMCGAQHPKADRDRLFLQRCNGRRGSIGLRLCTRKSA